LKWIELFENPFPEEVEVDYHHINNILCVPIPRMTHNYCCVGKNVDEHRERVNVWLYYLYDLDFDLLLQPQDYSIDDILI
jgi:hypothetical protein